MANTTERTPAKRTVKKRANPANITEISSSPESDKSNNITHDIPFREIMNIQGIDPSLVCSVIKEGLTASKKDEPDYAARFRYLELALQLLGIIPVEKREAKTYDFSGKLYKDLTDTELEAEYRARTEALRFAPDRS